MKDEHQCTRLPASNKPAACPHPAAAQTLLFPAHDYISGDRFEVVRCGACGLTVTMPQPQDTSAYYSASYYGSPGSRRFPGPVELLQNALYAARARRVERLSGGRKGRVLDVGCGRGFLLGQFQRRGWEVCGTELDDRSAAHAREVLKLPIQTGELVDLDFPSGHFDAVVMWHVLEHARAASVVLSEVARILKPGGVFLVGVPNFGSLEARWTRDNWFHLDVPRHLNHFTRDTLAQGLSAAGLVIEVTSYFAAEYDAFSFVQSILNQSGLRRNTLYDCLRGRDARVLGTEKIPWFHRFVSLVMAAPLGLLSVPAVALAGLMHAGATVTVVARKSSGRN